MLLVGETFFCFSFGWLFLKLASACSVSDLLLLLFLIVALLLLLLLLLPLIWGCAVVLLPLQSTTRPHATGCAARGSCLRILATRRHARGCKQESEPMQPGVTTTVGLVIYPFRLSYLPVGLYILSPSIAIMCKAVL